MMQMPMDMPQGPAIRADGKAAGTALGIDIVAIIVFVILGRSSHHESGGFIVSTLKVAAPFLIALLAGHALSKSWQSPAAPSKGVIIWVTTLVLGMLLRRFAFGRGTALAFIIVASLFIGLFVVGWRVVWEWWTARKSTKQSA
jgi:FtsH-binding integral membrane protein